MSNNEYKNNQELNEVTSILARKKSNKKIIIITSIIVVILLLSPLVASFIADFYTGSKLKKLFSSFDGSCKIIYEKSDYNIFSRHLKVSNVSLLCYNEEVAKFEEVDFAHIVSGSPLPANFSADITGGVINFNANFFRKLGNALSDVNITSANFSGHISATLGSNSKIFRIEQLNFNFEELGSLEIEFQVNNINSATANGAVKEIFSNNFSSLWVSFQDNGLSNKILQAYADYRKIYINDAKTEAIDALDRRILHTYHDEEIMRNNLIQIKRFFSYPSTISIKTDNNIVSLKEIISNFDYDNWRQFITSLEVFPFEITSN